MLIDAGFEGALAEVAHAAQKVEATGIFSGFWVSDTANDPFLLSAQALMATNSLMVGTNVAVAFARSPFVVAQTAWNLAGISRKRFMLGLGPQVKPHIEKRFSMPWPESPAGAMGEFLEVVRHLFDCFEQLKTPSFRGRHYRCTLGSPVFTPDHHEFGGPPVGISAVGQAMARLAGRSADLVFLHPFTHLDYLRHVSLPALEEGKARRASDLGPLQVAGSAFTVPTDLPNVAAYDTKVRERVAFYASTPNYFGVLECLGLEKLHQDLHALSRQGKWREMGAALPKSLLEACVVRAPLADLPHAVRERFQGIYDRVLIDATPWAACD
jgi:probable F420-dependent oxidoreductase